MLARAAKKVAWASWGLTLALLVGGLVLSVLNRSTVDLNTTTLYAVLALSAVSFSTVGGLISRRHPSNPIAWLFCLMGLALAAVPFAQEYAIRGRYLSPGSLPASDWFGYASNWLFLSCGRSRWCSCCSPPDGALSPRWRIAGRPASRGSS